nr:MAG TPA: hypothetical protein [Caudoviricetes sp.]
MTVEFLLAHAIKSHYKQLPSLKIKTNLSFKKPL